jgi:hypothetical protein
MNSWKRAIAYVSCVAVFLGFCLYIVFRVMLSSAPTINTVAPYISLLSDALPWFFWTAAGFVVISLVLGFLIELYVTGKKPLQPVHYILGTFLIAFIIEVGQTIAFAFLCAMAIPPSYHYLGTTFQESVLDNFFLLPFSLPLYCFFTAGAGLGLYTGRQIRLAGLTS